MLNLNTLLSLIFQCKKTGSGKLGNGRIYVKLMQIIADREIETISSELGILRKFGSFTAGPTAYTRMDKFLNRYIKTGKNYPFQLFKFEKYEKNYSTDLKYLTKMKSFCDEVLDERKIQQLVYTLLEIIHQDSSIETLIYGTQCISKNELFGSYAHPKNICLEALLLGLLYYVHKYSSERKTLPLLKIPDRLRFAVVRYKNISSFELDKPVKLAYCLSENSVKAYATEDNISGPKRKYELEMYCENELITELPKCGNIFIYGTGGAGKSTLLLNEINRSNSVNFYFPLYKYKSEFHKIF